MIHLEAHCGEVAEDFDQVLPLVPVAADFSAEPGFARLSGIIADGFAGGEEGIADEGGAEPTGFI